MFATRQLRLRVLEMLERRARQFRTTEDLYPCRIPRQPVALADLIREALPEDHHRFDPLTLRSRTLLRLEWEEGSTWELWVVMLPSGLKLFCDWGEEEARVLASGGRHASAETDRQFLSLLAGSAGELFGIEMAGGAPSVVKTPIADREFLADMFVELFEVTGNEESLRRFLLEHAHQQPAAREPADGRDFRADVEAWLDASLVVSR
jgi:hypothetical protein